MLSQYSITALIQGYTNLFVDELYVTDKQLYKKKIYTSQWSNYFDRIKVWF